MNLGVIQLETGRFAEALQSFDDTRQGWVSIVEVRPELREHLANTLGWIAKARAALGEFDGAIYAQKSKILLLHDSGDFAKNRRMQRLVANAHQEISQLHLSLGEYAQAVASAREAVVEGEALVVLDGTNMLVLAQTVFARLSLAESELALGHFDAANAIVDGAWSDALRVVSTGADANKWQIPLRGRLLVLAAQLAAVGRRDAPTAQLSDYLSLVNSQLAAGKPLDPEELRTVVSAELVLGDLFVQRGQVAAAQEVWRTALQRLRPSIDHDDLILMTLFAQAQLRLGSKAAARSIADVVGASQYRHPSYADLRQRLARPGGAASAL
jgi:tetratricopeptide (TPR) repeat protein